ncbi:MAG: FtsW/RodA/SpoVE family cell cycle protein [Clostridiaceae bacterium]|jgi:rod shape determining protein RodA|nr:FtsW/RodA/SpoVE family cell cycle protein [Eubacteriales bacterium]NLV48727.1 FtsW/RodA/SpoVE family cell cycle protein [Clostridiaceae bacterium]
MARTGFEQLKKQTYFSIMDYYLLIPVIIIVLIGLSVLSRVLSQGFGDAYPMNLYRQIGAALAGVLIALLLSVVEVPTMRLIAWSVYGVSLLLLVVVLVDNFSLAAETGSDSWLNLPVIGSFQPSELTKIGLAMTSAYVLEWISTYKRYWQGVLILLGLFGVPLILITRQPDFGTAMVIVFIFVCMLFVWGIRWRYVLLGLSGFLIMIPLAWFFYFEEFQKNRILTFLYPGHDPAASYNLMQARLAIASGGLIGSPRETPVHVPVKESDFIYTAVSEHMGLIGTTALLLLIFFFLIRGLYVASKVSGQRSASALMLVGIIAGMAFHYIENLGMCVGLLPITGIPLPFVSLGGSSMVVNFLALGVMLSISMDRNLSER